MTDTANEAEYESAVAIVGMSGRFPGAADVGALLRNLRAGIPGLRELTDEELSAAGVGAEERADPGYVRVGAAVADLELFDAAAFGFGVREAEATDPHHRLVLECSWEALESAGYCPTDPGTLVGVFAGCAFPEYMTAHLDRLTAEPGGKQLVAAGMERDSLASLVSYKLGLRGPSLTVQTFCSTSLVAVHLACQSLVTFECDTALAGGAFLPLPPHAGYHYEAGGILSPDGRVRALDAAADGTVMGAGAAMVALKRLPDALADGDTVHAVILGSAMNNDGRDRAGYSAPAVAGQAAVIESALAVAGVEPGSIGYVECHAVGTPLGDSIELSALNRVLGPARQSPCVLGSVKPSIGHLDRAAGVTGLLRAALSLRDATLPATAGYQTPNPALAAAGERFTVLTEDRPWPAGAHPRRAGVNSFGVGGTNAHVVLEEPPPRAPRPERPGPHLLTFSAADAEALAALTRRLREHIARHPEQDLADVAYTLQVSRGRFGLRRAVVCRDRDDAVAALADPARWIDGETRRRDPLVGLVAGTGVSQAWWAELAAAIRLLASDPGRTATAEPEDVLAALRSALGGIGVLIHDPEQGSATGPQEIVVVAPDGGTAGEWLPALVARLWQAGSTIDWAALHQRAGRRIELPTYPFQRKRYWLSSDEKSEHVDKNPDHGSHLESWRRHPLPSAGLDRRLRAAGPWLILGGEGQAQALADRLVYAGAEVVTVRSGQEFVADDGDFALRPADTDDLGQLVRSLVVVPRTVVHGFSLGSGQGDGVGHFEAEQERGHDSVLAFAAALADAGDLPVAQCVLLTPGVVGVFGPDLRHPEHAGIAALAPALAERFPQVGFRHVDVAADADLDQVLSAILCLEHASLAVRGDEVWRPQAEPCPLPEPDADRPPLNANDTVLITGGLGGGGLVMARHLAEHYQCGLVLITGSTLIGESSAALAQLERAGSRVLALPLGSGDEVGLKDAIRRAADVFGAVDLVIHAVGGHEDGPAAIRDLHALAGALGGQAAERRLVLCPSAGSGGMRTLEAYARTERLHGRGRWTFAVWDTADLDNAAAHAATVEGLLTVAGQLSGLTVRGATPRAAGDAAAPVHAVTPLVGATRPRPATLSTGYIEPEPGLETEVAGVWAAGLGLERIGADDNFFELGGRSATAVQIADRLADAFAVQLPLVAVMEYPTVRLIGQRIRELSLS
ncbi:KR domain-containing protein [Actinospica durhamensis]|uniref:KR domain-containing protein n=1 Tax=Actinospica durhamensis TaxID=1508375 RepID=A0A941EQZ5_9ACTN|nr:beta-ketoacyl synthase N-terminal-like domain-containing protein [Actinospica durhamensis]MBR7833514.1 KR domain-containing protein [Actinospica durhamensis]